MVQLSFAEQVKVVLSRKNMTIKQLAEEIEILTGMKMSRQNLTQRLGRDNFQEKDMRMIAEILDCPFRLSILDAEAELVDTAEIKSAETKQPEIKLVETKPEKTQMVEVPVEKPVIKEVIKEEIKEEVKVEVKEVVKEEAVEVQEAEELHVNHPAIEIVETKQPENQREVTIGEIEPTVKSAPASTSDGKGDINPYTGYEYKTNSVRSHPKRIGYVQVYDRVEHKWTDMTEWAFLGFQERQKLALGKAYEEPTYLD